MIGAHRLQALLLQHAQHFGLRAQAHVGDFVEEERPSIGLLKFSDFILGRAGEAAFHVPEQLGFDELLRNRRAIDFDKCPVAAQARGVQGSRDEFLARSAFSVNQDAPIRGSRQRNLLPQRAHRNGIPLQLRASPEFLPELPVFLRQAVNFERVLDDENDFFQRERLLDEIERAKLGGPHGGFDAGVPGNHHDHRVHAVLAYALQRVEPVDSIQPHIQQDQIDGALLEQRETFLAGRYGQRFVSFVGQDRRKRLSNPLLVIHDENGICHESRKLADSRGHRGRCDLRHGKLKNKFRAGRQIVLDADRAVMLGHDAAGNRQAEPRAAILG